MIKGVSIGVDIGSTSIKAIALEHETRRVLDVVTVLLDSREQGLPSGHHEEDPRRIQELTWGLLLKLGRAYGERVAGIAFTGQMHSGMIVNARLDPLTNLVTWQDKRGDELASDGQTYADLLARISGLDPTGVGIHSGFLATTTLWWRQNGLQIPAAAYPIGIYDWLTSLLVGHAVTDITSAAAWGLFDIEAMDWRWNVLAALGLRSDQTPTVHEPGDLLGTIQPDAAKELSLSLETKVYASIGDTQASYLGAGTTSEEILLNFGTGSQSMWETSSPIATPGTDIRYLRNDRYIVTAPTLAGGAAYRILAEFYNSVLESCGHPALDLNRLYDIMNDAALRSGSRGIAFDPIFGGSRWRDPSARASISGLTCENFKFGSVTHALLAGMIEEIAAPYFTREVTLRHKRLRGAGNGMRRNGALRKIAEERFALSLVLSESEEEAARGAALLTLD